VKLYEGVAQALVAAGIDRLFGVMGDANMRYVSAYRSAGRAYVGAAHEAGAIAMAEGHARAADRLGAVTITHGPGVTNGLTALVEAVRAGSALVVLTGSTPPKRTHNQWLDLRAAADLAGAAYRQVQTPATAMDDVALAMRTASVLRRPVLLDIPAALIDAEIGGPASDFGFGPWSPVPCAPGDAELDAALGVIASARRPIVVVGQGAANAGAADAVRDLAQALHAPVAHTVMALGLLAGHPLDLGIFGSESHSLAIRSISEADCLIVLGASLNDHTTAHGDLVRDKAVVQVDTDQAALGRHRPVTVPVLADARLFAQRVTAALGALGPRPEPAWTGRLRTDLAAFDPAGDFDDRSTADTIDVRTAMTVLDAVLPADRAVVTDIGRFKTAAWRFLAARPTAFAQSGSFGAIGLGLQLAIGTAFARPDRPTVAVVGDGGLMMGVQELATAVEHALPLVVAVANDGSYGVEYAKLAGFGHDPDHSRLVWPSFAGLARGFGAGGEVVRTADDIERLGPRLAAPDGPLVLDIRLDAAVESRTYK
jgi:thiamine pyrophosphate-dependent acetolactate synthase large subunit-like protein